MSRQRILALERRPYRRCRIRAGEVPDPQARTAAGSRRLLRSSTGSRRAPDPTDGDARRRSLLARKQALRLQLLPQPCRHLQLEERDVVVHLCARAAPDEDTRHRGMAERELDGGRSERHLPACADLGQSADTGEHRRLGRRVVVVCVPRRATPLLNTPPAMTATPRSRQSGSSSSSALVSSSVYRPASRRQSMSVSRAKRREHLGLVHPDADRAARRPRRGAVRAPGTHPPWRSSKWSSGSWM